LCPANHMACGNGKERTEHPSELFGDDWQEWGSWVEHQSANAADSDDTPPADTSAEGAQPGLPSTRAVTRIGTYTTR